MKRAAILILALVLWLQFAPAAWSQGYELDWWTVDNGGDSEASSAGYSVNGSIGQPDAAVWRGNHYTLSGGFWVSGSLIATYQIFLPVILRNAP